MLDEKRKELRTKAYKRICDKAKLIPIWDSSFSAIKIITLQSLKRGRVILREESDLIRSLGQSGLCGLGFTDGGGKRTKDFVLASTSKISEFGRANVDQAFCTILGHESDSFWDIFKFRGLRSTLKLRSLARQLVHISEDLYQEICEHNKEDDNEKC